MALSLRQKLTIISLLIYWPGIFILAHMPIPQLVYKARVSDKVLHCLVYLILVFLLWFAINPDRKVNWRKAAVWWILLVVVWYGAVDEWLQAYVGRNPAVMDFLANLAGTLTGLILFSFFAFWSALLVVTAITIFLLTNLARANIAVLLPITNAAFHLFAYAFFTMLWIRHVNHFLTLKVTSPKWLIVALALPIGFLSVVKLFSVISGRYFGVQDVIISAAAITAVVATVFLLALFRWEFARTVGRSTPGPSVPPAFDYDGFVKGIISGYIKPAKVTKQHDSKGPLTIYDFPEFRCQVCAHFSDEDGEITGECHIKPYGSAKLLSFVDNYALAMLRRYAKK